MSFDRLLPSSPQVARPQGEYRIYLNHIGPLLIPVLLIEGCWLCMWLLPSVAINPWAFQGLFAVAFAGYFWALLLLPRLAAWTRRGQIATVLIGTLLFHCTLLQAPLALSDDLYRYVWNGRVSAADIDPYSFAPGDPALAPLRDEAIWPGVNAKEQPSPYPPLLEAWFALVYRLWSESLLAMRVAMVGLNIGVVVLLFLLLERRGQQPIRALVYAWSPQVVLQVAFSGHNEPLLVGMIVVALVIGDGRWAIGKRWGVRDARQEVRGSVPLAPLAGAWALALATLAKLVPVFALPLLLRRWGWRAAAVYTATLVAVYGALALRGQQVFDGALIEAGAAQFNDGLHYVAYRLAGLLVPGSEGLVSRGLLLLGMGAVLLWLLRERSQEMTSAIGRLLAAYVVLAASVAPWYTLWVLPFVALDALPKLPDDRRGAWARLLGSYWIWFSWTAIFSEVFYTASTPVWRVFHIAEYLMPLGVLVVGWWWGRRSGERGEG